MAEVQGEAGTGGLSRLIREKAPWAWARRREKWAEESKAGENQYPSHRTESSRMELFPFDLDGRGELRGASLAGGPPVY